MGFLTNSLWMDLLILLFSVLLVSLAWLKRRYQYWESRGVPFAKPVLVFGSFKENILGKTGVAEIFDKMYKDFKGERVVGYFDYHEPKLLVIDPELISKLVVKDFPHFHDRGVIPADIEYEPLSNNISSLEGAQWRQLRYKLLPVFTSGKLKGMFEQIYNCGQTLLEEMQTHVDSQEPFEARDITSIFTNDVIASCAFGLQFSLNSPEGKFFKKMVLATFPKSRFTFFFMLLRAVTPNFSKMLNIRTFSKEVTEYFVDLAKKTMRYREENKVVRNDFFGLLLNLKKMEDENVATHHEEEENEEDDMINQLKKTSVYDSSMKDAKVMTEECLAASSFIFLVAGSEVSTAISFLFYCLVKNPEVQEKLQQEIDSALEKHGGFNYASVKAMVYMDQVIQESLRLYPIAPFIARQCTIPYRVPDSDLTVEKDSFVTIPVKSIQMDPRYYPDPESFKPERFVDNNYKPSPTYMPFGDGPRICIALRFAVLEMKICTARIMSRYSLKLHSKTPEPLRMDPHMMTARATDGIWLTVHRRGEGRR